MPPVSNSAATSITWLILGHLFWETFVASSFSNFSIRGRPKKIKNIANKASRRVGLSSENNRKAAKSLAGDSQDINHGWDTTVCCVPKCSSQSKFRSSIGLQIFFHLLYSGNNYTLQGFRGFEVGKNSQQIDLYDCQLVLKS